MVWVKIDDHFTDNPKIEKLSDRAFRLHVAGLCYCGANLTDGFVPDDRVRRLLPSVTKRMVAELVECNVWLPADGGYEIKSFLEYNPSKAKVDQDRAEAAERQRRWRSSRRESQRDKQRESRLPRPDPSRPDPSRPEGSRDGSTGSPLAVVSSPAPSGGDDTALPAEQVELNVSNIRAARERLREQAS